MRACVEEYYRDVLQKPIYYWQKLTGHWTIYHLISISGDHSYQPTTNSLLFPRLNKGSRAQYYRDGVFANGVK